MIFKIILINCAVILFKTQLSQCKYLRLKSQPITENKPPPLITTGSVEKIRESHEKETFLINDSNDFDNESNIYKEFPSSENYLEDDYYEISPAGGDDELPECILSRSEFYLNWWVHENGSLKLPPTNRMNGVGFVDLSFEIHTEEAIYSQVLSMQTENASEVIRFMTLANNNLQKIPLETLNLVNISLQYLSLANNDFYTLFHDKNQTFGEIAEFPLMTNLKELDLRNCSITTLDDFFDNLPFLEKLFLSNNRIVNVSDDTFGSLAHLNHLDLSYNKLWDFTPYSVTDPFQVYLSGMMLHEDVFRNLTNLVFLDLSHSKLKQESLRALQWLQPRLEQLSLCYTDVPLIISGMFAQTNLKVLDLSGNPGLISSLSNLWFSGLEEKLEILIFRSSNLKQIALIRNLRALKMLDLSNNNINQVHEINFRNLQKLQILDMNTNHISNWYERVFIGNVNLEIVNLRKNNINLMTRQMMMDLDNIKFLSMGGNSFVCDCSLRDFIDRARLNARIQQCRIERKSRRKRSNDIILAEFFDPNYYYNVFLRKYHSYFNNYNESLKNIIKDEIAFQPNRLSFRKSDVMENEECNNINNEGQNMNMNFSFILLDYTMNDYHCIESSELQKRKVLFSEIATCPYENETENSESEETEIITTEGGYTERIDDPVKINYSRNPSSLIMLYTGSTFLLVILFVAYFWKRRSIKYFFSVLKSSLILSLDGDDEKSLVMKKRRRRSRLFRDDFIYDVFVSYCDKDREWVLDHLIPNIEKRSEVTICLHERDFQVGLSILENIIQCMDQSRCLLLVISESFLRSNWCSFEMHLAQHRLIETRREQLILVLLQDIPKTKRPRTLNFLMKTKTYIMWPTNEDEVLRNIFWKRLRKAIVFDKKETNSTDTIQSFT